MRRVFLTREELPALLRGTLSGEPVALRRVLGARRSGRVGLLLALPAAALALPLHAWPAGLAVHLLLSIVGTWGIRRPLRLRLLEYQRVALWTIALPLWIAAPLRWLDFGQLPALIALTLGHALLWRGLRTLAK